MSPETIKTILEIVVSALSGGGVAIAFFTWLRDKDFANHKLELIELQSNADDKKQDNENLTRLIDSNEKIMTQLISAIGDSSKQHADTEKTRREIAQSVTTAIDGNSNKLQLLAEGLGMSTDNTGDKLDSIIELLQAAKESDKTRGEQNATIIDDIGDLAKQLESLENVPQVSLAATHEDETNIVSNVTIDKVQTPTAEDKDKE